MSGQDDRVVLFFRMVSAFLSEPIVPENYILGEPTDFVSPNVNTSIVIKPKISSSEYFDRHLGYNRADLNVLGRVGVYKRNAVDLHGLLEQINSEPLFQVTVKDYPYADYSTVVGQIYPDDVVNVDIPNFGKNAYIDIPMVARSNALFIKGSAIVRVIKE